MGTGFGDVSSIIKLFDSCTDDTFVTVLLLLLLLLDVVLLVFKLCINSGEVDEDAFGDELFKPSRSMGAIKLTHNRLCV